MIPILATLSEWHIILALIVIFLLFGGRKLPELARGIGEAMKEFRKAQRDVHTDDVPRPPVPPAAAAEARPEPTAANPALKPADPKAG